MKKVFVMYLGILGLMMGKELWAETYVSGIITSNATWTQTNSPYIATDTVTVANGVVLTIEPGVTIRFATETSLICYGTLNAVGTSIGTITFTSNQTTPVASDWNGIKLSDGGANGSKISYCNISYAEQAVYLENVSGIVITNNYIHHNKGDNGGFAAGYAGWGGGGDLGIGIYIYLSFNNIISGNIISNVSGGNGGGGLFNFGGPGGMGIGIYLYSSANNTISKNTMSNISGGDRGAGSEYPDGPGGTGCGIYLYSSSNNIFSENIIFNAIGASGFVFGNGYGIYIDQNSYSNSIDSNNKYNDEPIYYYCNQSGITIENQNLTLAGSGSTNLGRIVLINCQNFTIRNNTIAGGVGQNGRTGPYGPGGSGGIGCGIYLLSSSNGTLSGNSIFDNIGGREGIGDYPEGSGGIGCGIYLYSSTNSTISNNIISNNIGGQGGASGFGGNGCGIYLYSSTNNTISGNAISNNQGGQQYYEGYGIYGQGYGIYSCSNSFPIIHYNTLSGNKYGDGITKGYGVYHDGSSGTISATFNWWGADSGPYHQNSNPLGQGDKVSNWVDYQPWKAKITFIIPSSGPIGTEVTIKGALSATQTLASISFGTHLTITTTMSSINGTFSATFIVDTQTSGTKVITATDTEGNLATTTFILLPPTFLKIVPSYNLIAKNQEFDVDVKLEDVRNMAAVEVYLAYDPNILDVLELREGSFPSGASVSTDTTTLGQIYYFAGLTVDTATGSGILCSIKFKGKEGGSSTLVFGNDTALRDAGNIPIPFNKCEGLYYVATSISISPQNRVISAGNTEGYFALAKCGSGNLDVTTSATFTASGGGSFTTNNTFTAYYMGTYTISAEFLGTIGTTNVYITPGTPTTLLDVSGNNQISTCTETLANPFIVRVEDAYHNPCPNVSAFFAVISSPVGAEGYGLSSTQTFTNINGTTSSYLTLGDEPPGSYTIRASSGSLSPFDFIAWSLRRFGNIAGTCLIDYGTESQKVASIIVTLVETQATTTTNSNSYFIFTNIPVGTYTLSFFYLGATPATKTNVAITQTQFNDSTDIGTVTLIAGDPNGDGQINIQDWPLVKKSLGSSVGSPRYNPACDFNHDGKINIDDFMILRRNILETQPDRGRRSKGHPKSSRKLSLRFEPDSIEDARVGEMLCLNILISGARNSWGGELHLIFDPEVLDVATVTSGDWIDGIELKNATDNESGRIDYILGASEPETKDSWVFAMVFLKVKKTGVKSAILFDFDEEENRNTQFIEEADTGYELPDIDSKPIEVFAPIIYNNLDSSLCYPNPAKSQSYVTFKNLPNSKKITLKIMSIAGEVVYDTEKTSNSSGEFLYDLKNNDSKNLSSGVYIYLLDDGSNKRYGKLGVVR